MRAALDRAAIWAAFVKIEHTLFSLPVLCGGAVLAAGGRPAWGVLGWITLAGAGARTLALALNRLIDHRIDALNPRTRDRELPAGRMTVAEGRGIALAGALAYGVACSQLPPICWLLSPVPVFVFVFYPYLKRVTPLAHFGVGLALALAPLGAYVAVRGTLEDIEAALWLAGFTWMWVAGFDIIYATLDEDHDREHGIQSLPARFGRERALWISAATHAVGVASLVVLYGRHLDGGLALAGIVVVGLVLLAEQRLASRVNLAFFHLNLVVGFLVFAVVVAGTLSG